MITNGENMSVSKTKNSNCFVDLFVAILGSKWKPCIIWHLRNGPQRFTELQKKMNDVNSKTITTHLRELENLKIISRVVYPEVPPRVEYSLTDYGKALFPVYDAMLTWSMYYLEHERAESNECKINLKKWSL
jgi:DNA-binding HxlR family transcriptional regulator